MSFLQLAQDYDALAVLLTNVSKTVVIVVVVDKQTSTLKTISASIIQGSAIGPAPYVVDASDLQAVTIGNALCKYAYDTYLIIPAVNVDSRSAELHNVNEWALANNLKLNLTKSQEIIFTDQRRKAKFSIPDKIPLLQRVSHLPVICL